MSDLVCMNEEGELEIWYFVGLLGKKKERMWLIWQGMKSEALPALGSLKENKRAFLGEL